MENPLRGEITRSEATSSTDRWPSSGSHERGRAVVIGGSMAGLLAARVLSEHFRGVTLVERDRYPAGFEDRKGVPQGRHAHALMPRGAIALEKMFPGLMGELIADGATAFDLAAESRVYQRGGYRARFESGRPSATMTRPLLEGHVRQRVEALDNVTFLTGHAIASLSSTPDRARVTGVVLETKAGPERSADGDADRKTPDGGMLPADLVVDASGRGSRAPVWLEAMGYGRPPEEKVDIGLRYTTRFFRRSPEDLPGARFAFVLPTPPRERRMAAMFNVEGGRWMVTLGGSLGERPPADERGFLEFARGLPAPDIHDAIKEAEPLGGASEYNFPANLRRRYERLNRVPEGYLVTGDALCSFNPIYGQGMSVGAMEAEALDACLREGLDGLPNRFYHRAARVLDAPWRLAAGTDLAFEGVTGHGPPGNRVANWWLGRVQLAATRDPGVCRALGAVTGLVAPPGTLLRPGIALRVIRHGLFPRREPAASE